MTEQARATAKDVLGDLDAIAREHDRYEFGLPLYGDGHPVMERMIAVVVDAFEARDKGLKAWLRRFEWLYDSSVQAFACPECDHIQNGGHADDCRLAAVLEQA